MTNHSLANFDAAPYVVYRWAGEVAPTRPAPRYKGEGDDGSGAVATPPGGTGTAPIKRRADPRREVYRIPLRYFGHIACDAMIVK